MRKLVTIQKIYDIQDIPERQKVQRGKVLGWDVIIATGSFKNSELVCFAEIDSLFPKDGNWDELEKFKYRIKTFKVNTPTGPIYGQGYCFPLTVLEKYDNSYPRHYEENEEITSLLGVIKYEPPVSYAAGDTKGSFPTMYISETDEIRLQSKLDVLEELRGKPYVIRQKCDGCLDKDTILNTNIGKLTIQNIVKNKINCKVKSFNINKQKEEYKNVLSYSEKKLNKKWIEIKTKSGKIIKLTEDHPIYMPLLFCYRSSNNLKIGDIIKIE